MEIATTILSSQSKEKPYESSNTTTLSSSIIQKGLFGDNILRFVEWKKEAKTTFALGYSHKSLILCLDF
jgi:hypothetical protein